MPSAFVAMRVTYLAAEAARLAKGFGQNNIKRVEGVVQKDNKGVSKGQ